MANEGKNKHQKFWIGIEVSSLLVIFLAIYFLAPNSPSEKSQIASIQLQNARNLRLIIIVSKLYAADHDGNYPSIDQESGPLSVLVPDYLDSDFSLFWFHPKTKEKIPWLYNPGLSDASFSRTPLLAQPIPFNGKRIVGYAGGQVIAEREEPKHPFHWPPKPAEPPLPDP